MRLGQQRLRRGVGTAVRDARSEPGGGKRQDGISGWDKR